MAWYDFLTKTVDSAGNAVTGVLESDSVEKLIDAGANYAAQRLGADEEAAEPKTQSFQMPSWAVPAGLGLAALLAVVLVASMARRR